MARVVILVLFVSIFGVDSLSYNGRSDCVMGGEGEEGGTLLYCPWYSGKGYCCGERYSRYSIYYL